MKIIYNPNGNAKYVLPSDVGPINDTISSCASLCYKRKSSHDGSFVFEGPVQLKVYKLSNNERFVPRGILRNLNLLRTVKENLQGTPHQHSVLSYLDSFYYQDCFYVVQPYMHAFQVGFVKVVRKQDEESRYHDSIEVCPFRGGPISEDEGKVIYKEMMSILQHLHRLGYYVPGLSLSHILINEDGRIVFDILELLKPLPTGVPNDQGLVQNGTNNGNFPIDSLPFLSPELYSRHPYDPMGSDAWTVTTILVTMMACRRLYRRPHPDDLGFRLHIMAGVISPDNLNTTNNLVVEGSYSSDEASLELLLRAVPIFRTTIRFSRPLLELLTNTLTQDPLQRWNIEQILASDWMTS